MLIAQILPKNPNVPFSLINRTLTKKNVSDVIDAVYRHCGQKECVIFADRLMGLGFGQAAKAGLSFGKDDLIIPDSKPELIAQDPERGQGVRAAVPGRADHRRRALQQGGGRLVALHRRGGRRDDEGDQQAGGRHADQLGLDDEPLRRARIPGADASARRHARPDGQALGRDHRAADHRQLQGGALGPRILQLHPRRPQGAGGHGVEDGELRLPDAAPGRRGAGLHHRRAGLRHRAGPHRPRGHGRRRGGGRAGGAHPGPHHGRGRARPGHRRDDGRRGTR